MDERLISEAKEYVTGLFQGNAGGHDVSHTMRVYGLALRIAETEPEADLTLVTLGALLHDADDAKLFATENNENARRFLAAHGISGVEADVVCEIINGVSFSKNRGRKPASLEGKIVQDADRLDAIGAVGIARTFAYGGEHGRPMEESVRHFYEKLLLIQEEMNTPAGKEIAAERHAFLEEFLRRYHEETGTDANDFTDR